MYEPQQIVIVVERLTSSHHDNVGHAFSCTSRYGIDLVEHLRRCEISLQAVERRGAEPASHTAADLRGDTDRIAVVILHPDTFDKIAVRKFK